MAEGDDEAPGLRLDVGGSGAFMATGDGRTKAPIAAKRRDEKEESVREAIMATRLRDRVEDILRARGLLLQAQQMLAGGRSRMDRILEKEKEAIKLLKDFGSFDEVLRGHTHGYAQERDAFKPSVGNPFAVVAARNAKAIPNGEDTDNRKVISLGEGYGNDADAMAKLGAHVTAVDGSSVAVAAMLARFSPVMTAHMQGGGRVTPVKADLMKFVQTPLPPGERVRLVLLISVLHLFPPATRVELLKQIRENLLDTRGSVAAAMKLKEGSASANRSSDIVLTGPPHNLRMDPNEGILRGFPQDEFYLDAAMQAAGLRIGDGITDEISGYDQMDEVERFRFVRATVDGNGGKK